MENKDQDRIENFIRSNRGAFDDEVPSERVWEGISGQIEASSGAKKVSWEFLWKVAAVLFFACSAYLFVDKFSGESAVVAGGEAQIQVGAEFEDVEFYYTSIIEAKKKEITLFASQNIERFDGQYKDMKKLNAMYLVLKEELENNPSKQVMDALILNLLLRIDMLNGQLIQLERIKAGEGDATTKDADPSV